MRTIPTLATATLPARAVFARDWAGGWLIVTDDPAVQVVDPALATITASALAAVPVDVTTDATGAQLVVAFEDALVARSATPRPGASPASSSRAATPGRASGLPSGARAASSSRAAIRTPARSAG